MKPSILFTFFAVHIYALLWEFEAWHDFDTQVLDALNAFELMPCIS